MLTDEFADLLEDLDEEAREARISVLRDLSERGCSEEEIRFAHSEGRLEVFRLS